MLLYLRKSKWCHHVSSIRSGEVSGFLPLTLGLTCTYIPILNCLPHTTCNENVYFLCYLEVLTSYYVQWIQVLSLLRFSLNIKSTIHKPLLSSTINYRLSTIYGLLTFLNWNNKSVTEFSHDAVLNFHLWSFPDHYWCISNSSSTIQKEKKVKVKTYLGTWKKLQAFANTLHASFRQGCVQEKFELRNLKIF